MNERFYECSSYLFFAGRECLGDQHQDIEYFSIQFPGLSKYQDIRMSYSTEIRHDAYSFSAKKSKGNWSIDEVEKILKAISNEDVEDF